MVDQLTDPASALHLVLLIGFVCVTALLMLLTVTNRLRLQRVVRAWPTGPVGGLPVAPLLFLAGIVGLLAYGLVTGHVPHVSLLVGYLVGGGCWLAAAYHAHSVVVTEFGIVPRLNQVGGAVAWGQVADYFRTDAEDGLQYVFFYTDTENVRCRLALRVPARHAEAFDLVVRAKLDARFEFVATQVYGKKAMEGGG